MHLMSDVLVTLTDRKDLDLWTLALSCVCDLVRWGVVVVPQWFLPPFPWGLWGHTLPCTGCPHLTLWTVWFGGPWVGDEKNGRNVDIMFIFYQNRAVRVYGQMDFRDDDCTNVAIVLIWSLAVPWTSDFSCILLVFHAFANAVSAAVF